MTSENNDLRYSVLSSKDLKSQKVIWNIAITTSNSSKKR